MKIKTNISIPTALQEEISNFAFSELKKFHYNPAGQGRRYCNLNNYNIDLKFRVHEFSLNCYKQLGIQEVVDEPLYGNFVGVNTTGAFVHQHTDPDQKDGRWHVRLNFMIQKPIAGGNVVIDGVEYEIDQGQSWINFASKWRHSSTPVGGDRARIVLSLGNCIEPTQAKQLLDQFILG